MQTRDERFLEIQAKLIEDLAALIPMNSQERLMEIWETQYAELFRQLFDWIDHQYYL